MTARRLPLLLSLIAATTAPAAAQADPTTASYPEVGSWGQAWGEDDPVPPASPTSARPAPALPSRPAAARPTAARPAPAAPAYTEVGSWGQAWGEDDPAPAAAPTRPSPPGPGATAAPSAAPVADRPPAAVRPTIAIRGEDEGGDAIGLRHPPRLLPKAVLQARHQREHDTPALHLEADQVIYDREFEIVTAKGRVDMVQGERTITADTVTYNIKQDLMGASGNVVLTEPTGEITHADYIELTGDMKNGVARQLRMILADDSRLAAQSAQRVGGDRTDFDKVVYTACEPCRDDPGRTPIWAVKAQRVTHNQAEAQIEYRDAWIEMKGVPVLYTPYLSHPDPSVKRKSGFLAPGLGYNSKLGGSVATPYFFVIDENEDVTLTPRFLSGKSSALSTDEDIGTVAMKHLQLSGEHRWRGVYGEEMSRGSITADQSSGDLRGYIDSKGMIEMGRTWRAGWQAQYQSDETFRQLYKVRMMDNDRPWLMTRPYVEGFGRRNYLMTEMMAFQGHRVIEDDTKSPVVLPHTVYHAISAPGWAGSTWTADSDLLSYTRSRGTVAQRLSQTVGWSLPVSTPDGQAITLMTSLRGDGYRSDDLPSRSGNNVIGLRGVPQVAATWRYPFTRIDPTFSQVIEPVAMIAASPIGGNSTRIPNEDSQAFELDETNVLRPNRLAGLDRVEGGLRGAYGVRWAAYPNRGGRVGVQVAQGWRQHDDSTYPEGSGFSGTLSDYVGRVDIAPTGYVSLTDRMRLDRGTLDMRRNETTLVVGPRSLSAAVSYGLLSSTREDGSAPYPRRRYITYTISSALTENWSASTSLNQDLASHGGTVDVNARTTYSDECFALTVSLNRYFTTAPGLLSGYDAMVTIVLKSLGEAPVSLF